MTSFSSIIEDNITGKVCVVGVGNSYLGDDAAGCYAAELLKHAGNENLFVVNAEEVIENHVVSIGDSDVETVIIIDAVASEMPPGSIIFGKAEEILERCESVSSHNMSIEGSVNFLKRCGKKVLFFGISADSINPGQRLTPDVNDAVCSLVEYISTILACDLEDCDYEC